MLQEMAGVIEAAAPPTGEEQWIEQNWLTSIITSHELIYFISFGQLLGMHALSALVLRYINKKLEHH